MTPEELLAGPRGRRLLLEFAMLSERTRNPDFETQSFIPAVWDASYALEPGNGVSVIRVGLGPDQEEDVPEVTPAMVANAAMNVHLIEVTPEHLVHLLEQVVGSARYWQEPEGADFLAATDEMRPALQRVADHIAASPHVDWWHSGVDLSAQWSAQFSTQGEDYRVVPPPEDLHAWREETIEAEFGAARNRPQDPAANYSGIWWSIPPTTYPRSIRELPGGMPAALIFAEDAGGFDKARTRYLIPPTDARIYEVDGAGAWVELCRIYPLAQTAQKRHDWYRTTGRVGKWVMPDWSQFAEDYDAIHLTVAGYLSAAGNPIPVEDETASVIAGWNPDETWWLGQPVEFGETTHWRFINSFEGNYWERDT